MTDEEIRERCAQIVLSIEIVADGIFAGAERSVLRRAAYLIRVDRTDREDDQHRSMQLRAK